MTETNNKSQQTRIMWLCWLVYTIAYIGRYSYTANVNLIMENFGANHAQTGMVTTCFFFAYGIGQVINGFMCRRYNKKYIFPIVLFASSIINLLMTVVPFWAFKYLWLLNGVFQSCLWSSIINVLGRNIDSERMNKALLVIGTTVTTGTIFAYGSSAFFVWLGNFRLIFCFAAIAMSLVGVIWLLMFRPVNAGQEAEEKTGWENKGGIRAIGAIFAAIAFFAVIDNLVKDGISTWVPAILTEQYGLENEVSILSSLVLPLIGVFGAMVSVTLNKYIKNFVALMTVLYSVAALLILIITLLGHLSAVMMIMCFGVVMCMMHAVNNVITSIAPLKMREKADPGKVAGFLNGFCYLGSTISSYGLGAVADLGGWQMVFNLLLTLSAVCVIFGLGYTIKTREKESFKENV